MARLNWKEAGGFHGAALFGLSDKFREHDAGEIMGIQVVVRSEADTEQKGWTQRVGTELADVTALERGLSSLSEVIDGLPDPSPKSNWQVAEIELTAELTAEGGIRVLGVATAGVKGGVTFRLVPRTDART